jgi:hypothetical protein
MGSTGESWQSKGLGTRGLIVRDGMKEPHAEFGWLTEEVGRLLCFIGLMRITTKGGWVPTNRLLNLVAECRQRDKKEGEIERVE